MNIFKYPDALISFCLLLVLQLQLVAAPAIPPSIVAGTATQKELDDYVASLDRRPGVVSSAVSVSMIAPDPSKSPSKPQINNPDSSPPPSILGSVQRPSAPQNKTNVVAIPNPAKRPSTATLPSSNGGVIPKGKAGYNPQPISPPPPHRPAASNSPKVNVM